MHIFTSEMTIVCLRNDIGMPSEFVGPIFIQIFI